MAKIKNEKLELAKYMTLFSVVEQDDEYVIKPVDVDIDIAASIDKITGEINYYVTGVYNAGYDWATIDMKALMKLKDFVKVLLS